MANPTIDDERLEFLRDKVLDLLARHGVKMEHPEVVAKLAGAGAEVDPETLNVRLPRDLVERSLAQAPGSLRLAARGGGDLEIPRPDGTFHLRTGTGSHGWIDLETGGYRKVTIADVADWGRLSEGLEEVAFCATPFANDVPSQSADVHGIATLLANTSKHLWVQPYSTGSIDYLARLAAAAAGGEDALGEASPVSIIACSFTPLEFKHMDLEVVRRAAPLSIPIHACSLPAAGGTAPLTMAGLMVMAAAEILALVAAVQAVAPGAPVIATPLIFALDMRSGRSLQTSVEAMLGAAGAVQLMKRAFGLPVHTYGSGTDSPDIDGQSMIERALLGLMVGLSEADILGGAGQLEVATAVSPLQLVIDDEIAGMVRRLVSGLGIDDETVAWDELMAIEPGSHFLTSRHTLRHCREGYAPKTFTRLARSNWNQEGSPDLAARAGERCRAILGAERPPHLSEDAAREIADIVEAADRHLIPRSTDNDP